MEFEEYTKQYGVVDPDNPLHNYDYRKAHKAGVKPVLWDTLPKDDKEEDIFQAMSGQRTGFPMTREEAIKFYKGHYMWPDEFKTESHSVPRKTILGFGGID